MIRDATPEDFNDVLRLYGQLHPNDGPIVDDEAARLAFDQIMDFPWLRLFVLSQRDEVVATAYLNVIPNLTRAARPYAIIENVVVEEALRGTGIGRQLMAATLKAAWSAGCYKAMLLTGSSRESTHGFYRSCGFSAHPKTGYVAYP